VLKRVSFVMKDGTVYKQEPATLATS
jgi:hypothetical protein